jgi:lipopolysaccharide biosynthesis glycosyltransferase
VPSSRRSTDIALAFAADEGYAEALAVAVHSALANLAPAVAPEVYVLDNGISERSRGRLVKVVGAARPDAALRWIRIPSERLAHLPTPHYFTRSTYSRLLIPEVLPAHVRRVVYLDVDILVRRDLSPLFTTKLGDAPIGAVRDFAIESTAHGYSGVREPADPRPYFNAGVLVIDVARWRETGLAGRALEYAAAGSEPLPWADQDALNATVESWHELDYRWNLQHASLFRRQRPTAGEFSGRLYGQQRDLYREAAVLHFTGQKPWYGSCTTRGTAAWVRSLMRVRWHTPPEAAIWLSRFCAQRARYWLGTLKLRLRERLTGRRWSGQESG